MKLAVLLLLVCACACDPCGNFLPKTPEAAICACAHVCTNAGKTIVKADGRAGTCQCDETTGARQ